MIKTIVAFLAGFAAGYAALAYAIAAADLRAEPMIRDNKQRREVSAGDLQVVRAAAAGPG